jgi:DNA-binding CsgD family transcriptional regulator
MIIWEVPRLAARDLAWLRDVTQSITTVNLDSPGAALPSLHNELESTLNAWSVSHRFEATETGLSIAVPRISGGLARRLSAVAMKRDVDALLSSRSRGWVGGYDAVRPQPRQRNRARTLEEILRIPGTNRLRSNALRDELYPRWGVRDTRQLRILVCDGPRFLAYLGVWRDGTDPFSNRERQILNLLAPSYAKRLVVEDKLQSAEVAWSAFELAIEAIAAPAFLIDQRQRIAHANCVGRSLVTRDSSVIETVRRSIAGASRAFSCTPLRAKGVVGYTLAIGTGQTNDVRDRIALASSRWSLTARQADVLALTVSGEPNKAIATTLGCAESTVEFHITALLRRARATSRAELAAKFWTLS